VGKIDGLACPEGAQRSNPSDCTLPLNRAWESPPPSLNIPYLLPPKELPPVLTCPGGFDRSLARPTKFFLLR